MDKKKEVRQINLAEIIAERYEPKEIVAFLATKLKAYNMRNGAEYMDRELDIYLQILSALNKKMGGGTGPTIL